MLHITGYHEWTALPEPLGQLAALPIMDLDG
jgi:hypothetical protein